MVIKILNKLLKLTMSLSEQLVELVKVAHKREIKLKEKPITGLKKYKGELEKATETVV